MADDATPESESAPAGAPGRQHAPVVIEGEAIEPPSAEGEPSPSEAPEDFVPTEPAGGLGRQHVPIVIEGEATELHPAEGEPSPSEAPENFASPQPPQAEADFASTEPPRAPAEPEAPAPIPDRADPTPRERKSGRAFVWGLCGAVLGGAAALFGAWYFEPGAGSPPDLTALEASAAAQSATAKALDARIGTLESAQAGFAKAAALDAIDKRIAKLESASVDPGAVATAEADARAARDEAAKALAQAAAAGQAGDKPAQPTAPAPDPRIAPLTADEAALAGRVDKLEAELEGRIDKLDTGLGDRIGKIEAALAAPKMETRVPPTEVAPKSDFAAQAIAALALEQRLGAGEPFAAEWAALSRLGADSGALAKLKPYSDTGAPTSAALAVSFAKIAPDLVAADNPENGDSVMDRMLDHVRKLVRVRAVGEVAGDDPVALVSQIQAALARGQTAQALGLYARLPEAARKAGADWARTADARVAADAAAASLRDGAIRQLAAAKN
jgi:hypothetical protein